MSDFAHLWLAARPSGLRSADVAPLRLAALVFATWLLTVGSAGAGPPAAIPDRAHHRAETAFEQFAADWMLNVRTLEQQARSHPTARPGAVEPVFTYRGYGPDYSLELRPTGHTRAPYVGLLRYTEHIYRCATLDAERCNVASSIPVTEIFRYKNGRWSY